MIDEAEKEELANHLDEDDETAEPYLDDEVVTEDIVSDADDDIAIDDEDYHSPLFLGLPTGERHAEGGSSCSSWLQSRGCLHSF